ncbi:glycoside hydrolase family 65 protein [Ornithobacterium rhinotracheale]|uniref:glycoside hydrolase family 65 protein n=1 Tax=Ornithobacterium rhinotracheale TaxID=28251 RepID=UPI00129C6309|nr:glycoside hydrolase family 65 protein [Ornithobacterium rhinotracheale]MRI63580.1 glycoside hydrolase family 65 protein [Ornithobacterium rhinotracheale]
MNWKKNVCFIYFWVGFLCFAQIDENCKIQADSYENYYGVALANGFLGMQSSEKLFKVEHIVLNNVFDEDPNLHVSQIVKGMNFIDLDLWIDGELISLENISDWRQTLELKQAKLTTSFNYKNKAKISYDIFALRSYKNSAMINVKISAFKPIEIKVQGNIISPENYTIKQQKFIQHRDLETNLYLLNSVAESPTKKTTLATTCSFLWKNIAFTEAHKIPKLKQKVDGSKNSLSFSQKLKKGENYEFSWLGVQCSNQESEYPSTKSERICIYNILQGYDQLWAQHQKLWEDLWQSDIVIEGDAVAQKDVRLALFQLYSSVRAGEALSIPPLGISQQSPYNGHIFWDAELWMYPPILLLNKDLAHSMLAYRKKHLNQAIAKAKTYNYHGAMFPWESDNKGEESTPTFALTGPFEHHITGDVGVAFWQYYLLTQDKNWLKNNFSVLENVADFWVSRATQNPDGSYSILNCIGANEFAHNVDDNAFTNAVALKSLQYAIQAAKILGKKAPKTWQKIANGLVFHQFENGITKEHKNYEGEIIKQVDVNLLAYPLGVIQDKNQILKDLKYYESKISPDGPAMSHAILSILYAKLGNKKEAERLFHESYAPYKRPPFGALAETRNSNTTYFTTAAGGLLQAVLFGFGGLEFTPEGIQQKNPMLPQNWKSLEIKNVGKKGKNYKIIAH